MIDFLVNYSEQSWHKVAYTYIVYFSYILFFIAFTGIVTINPYYLSTLETIIKYYVCAFLIIRFNPWAKRYTSKEAQEFDRKISYSAGIYLLLTTTFASIVSDYISQHKILGLSL